MGSFSKAIPQHKWPDVLADLSKRLKASGASWFSKFQQGTVPLGFPLKHEGLSDRAKHYSSMLQLSAVVASVQDNGYVSNDKFVHFLEAVYIVLTGNLPAKLRDDIEALPFVTTGDARQSLSLWASTMASELSSNGSDPRLIEELTKYGALLVIHAKMDTCAACGDRKGLEEIRKAWRS
jgi:hypothetical protein